MKSIMQRDKRCYITDDTANLHKHHIYGGSHRKKSEQYGFWVYLRADWHNAADYGVHFDRELDLRLKRECQQRYEHDHSREEFMSIIGKNYL